MFSIDSVLVHNLSPIFGQLLVLGFCYYITFNLIKKSKINLNKTIILSLVIIAASIFINLNYMQDFNEMVKAERSGKEIHTSDTNILEKINSNEFDESIY